jgi:hypothetical protein
MCWLVLVYVGPGFEIFTHDILGILEDTLDILGSENRSYLKTMNILGNPGFLHTMHSTTLVCCLCTQRSSSRLSLQRCESAANLVQQVSWAASTLVLSCSSSLNQQPQQESGRGLPQRVTLQCKPPLPALLQQPPTPSPLSLHSTHISDPACIYVPCILSHTYWCDCMYMLKNTCKYCSWWP